jgi:hypothetical protein
MSHVNGIKISREYFTSLRIALAEHWATGSGGEESWTAKTRCHGGRLEFGMGAIAGGGEEARSTSTMGMKMEDVIGLDDSALQAYGMVTRHQRQLTYMQDPQRVEDVDASRRIRRTLGRNAMHSQIEEAVSSPIDASPEIDASNSWTAASLWSYSREPRTSN